MEESDFFKFLGMILALINGWVLYAFKSYKYERVLIKGKLDKLNIDVSTLKSREMTRPEVKQIISDKIDPLLVMMQKFDSKIDDLKNDVVSDIKHKISELDAKSKIIEYKSEILDQQLKNKI